MFIMYPYIYLFVGAWKQRLPLKMVEWDRQMHCFTKTGINGFTGRAILEYGKYCGVLLGRLHIWFAIYEYT